MCGIAGFYQKDLNQPELIRLMGEAISYRGPDDSGIYIDQGVHFSHQRLSIIDLADGHQPMFNENKTLVIIFNGEIYNYHEIRDQLQKTYNFKTQSDTEVILKAYEAYGEKCLDLFNGMFAFAIYDIRSKTIFIARDRSGQKPLYYSHHSGFSFASELNSLKKLPWQSFEIDEDNLSKYFAYEYLPCPITLYKNIFKLEPGHYLKYNINDNSLVKKSWWSLDYSKVNQSLSFREAQEGLIEKLKKSLKYRMIADVPVGVFLSGGVDSSTCLALLKDTFPDQKLKTFSVAFENKSFDESSYSQEMANTFETDHYESTLTPQSLLEVIPDIKRNMIDPIADASIIPTYLLCKHAQQHVKVAIGGDAADELLSGYPTFLAQSKLNGIRIPYFFNQILKHLVNLLPTNMDNLTLDFLIKQTLKGMSYSNPIRNQVWLGACHEREINQLLPNQSNHKNQLYSELIKHWQSTDHLKKSLHRINDLYFKTYMTDDILTKVDRASMMNSLEVRAPFLDVNVMEYIATIPSHFKLKGKEGKYILKKAMESYLPNHILYRPKKGFGMPIAHWFRNELKEDLKEAIDKSHEIFDRKYLQKLFNEHCCGKVDHRKKLFSYYMVSHLIK